MAVIAICSWLSRTSRVAMSIVSSPNVSCLGTFGWAGQNAIAGRDTYGIGSAALLGAWSGILVNSIFVDTLHWRHLWAVAALIWAGTWRARRASP